MPRARKRHSSGVRQFLNFCSQMSISPPLPINEDILISFSVAMSRSVRYSTIKNHLSAVKNYHSSHGYELQLSNFLRLRRRGIKRSQGQQSKVCRPITLQLLNLFCCLLKVQHTDNALGSNDTCLFWLSANRRTHLQFNF